MKKIVHTSRNQMLQLAVEFEMNRLFPDSMELLFTLKFIRKVAIVTCHENTVLAYYKFH